MTGTTAANGVRLTSPPAAADPAGNGAHALLHTLADSGVDVCFANPGTSEMHFVAALDGVPQMRGVLTLFEGVATGAADGYARMSGGPAATLLHLGPGLGNGLANLHNARRAGTPVVNVVGDHAREHLRLDAPLQSDIAAIAGAVSGWVRSTASPEDVGADAAAAVAAARAGQVATLVLPADVSWGEGGRAAVAPDPRPREKASSDAVRDAADALRSGEPCVLLIGGDATLAPGLAAASRIAAATGAKLIAETFPTRLERGAGVAPVGRLGYARDQADHQLAGARHVVLVGARSPVAFFAYPDRDGDLVPRGAEVHPVVGRAGAATEALEELADLLAPGTSAATAPARRPELPSGPLDVTTAAAVIGALLPEGAIVVDEANTSGLGLPTALARAARHTLLTLTGGAIGQGMPVATGAAIAAPDRPVLNLEADGSALYTIQSLWTQARERSNVTTVLLNNSAYAILRMELARTGASDTPGAASARMLDLSDPTPDFVHLATGLGVSASRATTAGELVDQLTAAYAEAGPHLIEAIVPPIL
jgi:acetolactate synthase-1/2/3 large subunit